jgi:ketosteroid isomerase-like protein
VSIVHLWAAGFNKADGKLIAASCAEQAAIVDDFPPHEWSGPGACARWFTDFQAFAKQAEITDAIVAVDKAGHVDLTADAAYVVAPVTLTYRAKGKPVKLNGIIAVVLRQQAGSWHITALTWADL